MSVLRLRNIQEAPPVNIPILAKFKSSPDDKDYEYNKWHIIKRLDYTDDLIFCEANSESRDIYPDKILGWISFSDLNNAIYYYPTIKEAEENEQ